MALNRFKNAAAGYVGRSAGDIPDNSLWGMTQIVPGPH
jgi:hypothetical protein